MNPPHNPKQLLDTFGLDPKKSLGQNFLHDPGVLQKIIEVAELSPTDTVLEIGAGTGSLSRYVAEKVQRLIVVETDTRLRPLLEQTLTDFKNVSYIWNDFLLTDMDTLVSDTPYLVVANLPYYITSKILRKLLEANHPPQRLVITVQKEVADRIVAGAGDLSLLAISVQFYGTVQIALRLNPAVFYPRPDVESAVLRIDLSPQPTVDVPSVDLFFKVVRAGFGQKRKQLKNALTNGLPATSTQVQTFLDTAQISPQRRAETLTLQEWATLTHIIAKAEIF